MNVLRTPDEAFAGIADFPFAPHYCEIRDPATGTPLRIHTSTKARAMRPWC